MDDDDETDSDVDEDDGGNGNLIEGSFFCSFLDILSLLLLDIKNCLLRNVYQLEIHNK